MDGDGSPQGLATPGAPRPTVVLACSGPDASAMIDVARGLIGAGVRVDVVAGVELDARPIELALEQHVGPTLWVLCRSEELDDYQLELLALTVRATEVAKEHVIALPFEPEAGATFEALVRRRLHALEWIPADVAAPSPMPVDLTPVPVLRPERHDDDAPTTSRSSVPSGALAVLAIACVGLGAWAWSERGVEAAMPTEILALAAAPELSGARPDAAVATPHVEPPSATVGQVTDTLGTALADRRIRALDELLVTVPSDGPSTARRARSTCHALQIAGIHAWRLPDADELQALADAEFLPDDSSWWTARGRGHRRAHWSDARMHVRAASRRADAGVLCVATAKG